MYLLDLLSTIKMKIYLVQNQTLFHFFALYFVNALHVSYGENFVIGVGRMFLDTMEGDECTVPFCVDQLLPDNLECRHIQAHQPL